MKRLLVGMILFLPAMVFPLSTRAGVDVHIGIGFPLPPPIVFEAPPTVIVLPDTNNVYVVPYIDVDIFFWNGWWWRPWEGRWYRSRYYDRGWVYYNRLPSFYFDIDPGWRGYYSDRHWHGHSWSYEPIPYRRLQQNWGSWQKNRYWQRHGTWGVQNYQPRPRQQMQDLRYQRKEAYQQRPEVQLHQQQVREQQRQHRQPQKREQYRQEHSQPRATQPRGEPQQQKSHGKPERGSEGHGR